MKWMWNSIGLLAFVLGFMGLFLPVLPTTPFWLLSAFCFMRGSQQLYNWAMSYRTFNEIVTNFHIHRAIPLRVKIFSISTLWITIIVSCLLINIRWLTIVLTIIATAVTYHILSFRTLRDDKQDNHNMKIGE